MSVVCACRYFWARARLCSFICVCVHVANVRCFAVTRTHIHRHTICRTMLWPFSSAIAAAATTTLSARSLQHCVCGMFFFVCESVHTDSTPRMHVLRVCVTEMLDSLHVRAGVRVYAYVCMFVSKLSIYNTVIRPHFVWCSFFYVFVFI